MCVYQEICPGYDNRSDDCNKNLRYGSAYCIGFLLEAYHEEKGTDFFDIVKYLHIKDDTKDFKLETILDVFKSCDKEYQESIYKTLGEVLDGRDE